MPHRFPIDRTVDTYSEPQSNIFKGALYSIRATLEDTLSQCSEGEQDMFRRMYPEGIDAIPIDKLDWACKQVENTLAKRMEAHKQTYPPVEPM